jgi:hypothetical protein
MQCGREPVDQRKDQERLRIEQKWVSHAGVRKIVTAHNMAPRPTMMMLQTGPRGMK